MTAFTGCFTALITPFKGGKVDEQAFAALIDWQINEGVQGIVPVGTTGESPTLSHDEHQRVVEIAVEVAAGRVPVMAGAGSNSTDEAMGFARHAQKAGADAVLIVAPYYNKPTQAGLYAHFKAVAEAADLPNFIYNIPARSVVNLTDETIAKLTKLPNIAGIKDATGDLARVHTLRQWVDDDFIQLSGEDMTAIGFNAQGGRGVISVTANIAPKLCAEIQAHCAAGHYKEALAVQETLVPLHQVLFCETNPAPVKYAASLMGLCSEEIRLPIVLPEPANQLRIKSVMQSLKLI